MLPNLLRWSMATLRNEGMNCAIFTLRLRIFAGAVSASMENGMRSSSKLLFCASKSPKCLLCSDCSWSCYGRVLRAHTVYVCLETGELLIQRPLFFDDSSDKTPSYCFGDRFHISLQNIKKSLDLLLLDFGGMWGGSQQNDTKIR